MKNVLQTALFASLLFGAPYALAQEEGHLNVRTIVHLQWLPARRSNREAARSVNVDSVRLLAWDGERLPF